MNRSPDRLYDLLPVIYRLRDEERGGPLRALLQVIAEQVQIVEDDIDQLYRNWFIETCDDWVVPYIADLIGYRLVAEAGAPATSTSVQGQLLNRALIPRREVANTIRYRRRKGALALLEELSRDVADWPARAVEFYRLLGVAQHLNHLLPGRGGTLDLRRGDQLARLDGPFDESAHTVDVRRINSARTRGFYSIPAVGLFVWRLRPYSITQAPAQCVDRVYNRYTFSILGNDAPLFIRPIDEPAPTHIADELNVPTPIRRRAFEERTADYYGPGKSLCIWRDGFQQSIPLDRIVPADLTDWAYTPRGDQVAVDPVLGRIAFAARPAPRRGVWVSYHYGFSADMGGGEYERPLSPLAGRVVYRVGAGEQYTTLVAALGAWEQDAAADAGKRNAVIEIGDSSEYSERIDIRLRAGWRLEIRAAQGKRPLIRLLDYKVNQPDALRVSTEAEAGEQADGITLDGLLIAGRSVQIEGRIRDVAIRHCTLVPGWTIDEYCEPEHGVEASLELIDTEACVQIERSILGTIRVVQNAVETEPISIEISDSIIDATERELEALCGPDGTIAHAVLHIRRCTIMGTVQTHAIELAENSIFDGVARVARRQRGCMRFCYVPRPSRTPRRYNCQPDLVERAVDEDESIDPTERDTIKRRERDRVRPQFTSRRYGTPAYCQLSLLCAVEIRRGADDQSEMGAFHDLFQPQREANLRARIDEFAPAALDADIVFVN